MTAGFRTVLHPIEGEPTEADWEMAHEVSHRTSTPAQAIIDDACKRASQARLRFRVSEALNLFMEVRRRQQHYDAAVADQQSRRNKYACAVENLAALKEQRKLRARLGLDIEELDHAVRRETANLEAWSGGPDEAAPNPPPLAEEVLAQHKPTIFDDLRLAILDMPEGTEIKPEDRIRAVRGRTMHLCSGENFDGGDLCAELIAAVNGSRLCG